MLKNIEVINVGFGDSFILSNEIKNESLKILVDCGTKNTINPDVINLVNTRLKNIKSFGILSHFHDDHYKYLNHLDKNIDEFFLPNYLSPINISILVKTYLLYRKNTSAHKNSEAMLRLDKIASCIKEDGKLTFISIKKDSPIKIIDNFRVLSPIILKNDKKELKLNEKMESFFTNEQLARINEFSENFIKYLGEDIQYSSEISCSINQERLSQIEQDLSRLEENINLGRIKITNSITNGILKNQHKYCIVFDRIVSNESSILFLGDVDKSIYKKDIYPIVKNNHYKYVKIIHHGTNPYYLTTYPQADFFIIPNGSYRNWRISKKYPENNIYKKTKLICTDNNGCAYYNEHKTSCSRKHFCGFQQIFQPLK